jgi:hypothetical protein
MKKQYTILFLAAITLVLSAAMRKGGSNPNKYAESITAGDLRKHLTVLASDAFEGRETGEKGQKMAAEYISSFFGSIGVPAQKDGSWFQQVKLIKISGGTSSFEIVNNGTSTKFTPQTDYYYASSTPDVSITTDEIVFAGYGIDDEKYSDYKLHDSAFYNGKVLVILDGEPQNGGIFTITGESKPGKWTKQRRAKLEAAKKHKVRAIIVVSSDYSKSKEAAQHSIDGYSLLLDEPGQGTDPNPPVFHMSEAAMNTILASAGEKQTIADLRNGINASGKPIGLSIKTTALVVVTRNEEKIVTENVLGFVEGSDLREEVIVITAHYDHLGKHDGVVFNGADDDGTGTVAVMELAEAFMKAKQDGFGPRRSVLFMTVSGEEKGLLGSAWYVHHPVYPLEKTMCDLNIDMIGRVDDEHSADSNFVYVIGSDKISPDLKKCIEAQNKKYTKLKLDYRYDDEKDPNMFYYRSDHYNFAKNGIPVAFFFNGTHADYHKETDEVSKINFSLMQKRTRLVFYAAWDLANRNKTLARKAVKK